MNQLTSVFITDTDLILYIEIIIYAYFVENWSVSRLWFAKHKLLYYIIKKYNIFFVLIYSYINMSENKKNKTLCGNMHDAAAQIKYASHCDVFCRFLWFLCSRFFVYCKHVGAQIAHAMVLALMVCCEHARKQIALMIAHAPVVYVCWKMSALFKPQSKGIIVFLFFEKWQVTITSC